MVARLWSLVLLHAWLFAYYVTVESSLLLGTLWACFWAVLLLQTAAFTKKVWFPRQRAGAQTPPHAEIFR